MPPVIKKHVESKHTEVVPDIQEIQSMFSQVFEERRHAILVALGIIALVAAIGVGVTIYRSSTKEKSTNLESEALNAYYAEGAAKDYTKALGLFEEASAVKKSPLTQVYTAEAYLKTGQMDKARESYQAFVSQHAASPLAPATRLKLALIEAGTGDTAKALSSLEALKGDPVIGDTALMEMARLYSESGQKDKELTALKEVETAFPDSPWVEEAKRKTAPPAASVQLTPAAAPAAAPAAETK